MDIKHYVKISRDDFSAIGWTQLRGAVTTDTGFYVERESPAHKDWLKLHKRTLEKPNA